MKYNLVQASIEQYVVDHLPTVAVQFDNVPFDAEMYTEYVRCNVRFGVTDKTAVASGCYRTHGLIIMSVFTKPGEGTVDQLTRSSDIVEWLTSKLIRKTGCPTVQTRSAAMSLDTEAKDGWVMAQTSVPFHYDTFQEN